MKETLTIVAVIALASSANGALSLTYPDVLEPPTDPWTNYFYITSDTDGPYSCWIEISDLEAFQYADEPEFTPVGDPAPGDSQVNYYEEYPGWREIIVASFNFDTPVLAGDHVMISIVAFRWGHCLNLYADDAETLLDSVGCVPEPATFGVLGLGGLALLRRRYSQDKS